MGRASRLRVLDATGRRLHSASLRSTRTERRVNQDRNAFEPSRLSFPVRTEKELEVIASRVGEDCARRIAALARSASDPDAMVAAFARVSEALAAVRPDQRLLE